MVKFVIDLVLFLASFVWFYYANKKFVQIYSFYSGKLLWSLLYFPLFFIICFGVEIINAFINFQNNVVRFSGFFIPLVIFGIGLWILISNTRSLFSKLYAWSNDSFSICTHKYKLILIVAITATFLKLIYDYQNQVAQYGDFGTGLGVSTLMTAIVIVLICGTIWYCGNNRLKWLRSQLNVDNKSGFVVEENMEKKEKMSSFDQLKEAKKLLDDGILSEEEFNKLKKEILNN